MKEFRLKCWVEEDGDKVLGPGPVELLKWIDREGSLSRAADQMNMSYKKAWDMIKRLNRHSEMPLVLLKKGGNHGGGAEVTSHGLNVVNAYEKLQQDLRTVLEEHQDFIKKL